MKKEIWILGGARTPFGEFNGKLKAHSEIDLGAIAGTGAVVAGIAVIVLIARR